METIPASPARRQSPPLIGEALWPRRERTHPVRYHEADIALATPVAIAEGILLVRLPLPFALNHINVYLVDEGDGWTIVDCGLDTPASRESWEAVFAHRSVCDRAVRRIVVTHHHPDHVGLAGWLAGRFGVPMAMTAGELAVAGRYADPKRDVVAERTPFWHEHGLPQALVATLLERMPRYSVQVHALPDHVDLIDTGTPFAMGGRMWKPVVGRGHSPDHLSLVDEAGEIVIGGDQVLPKITPNIGVWPGGDPNPLRSYLESLEAFTALGEDPLLLPSHKQPLHGIAARVDEIRQHHEERLQAVADACERPVTCHELLPVLFGRPLRNEELGFGLGEGVAHLNFLEGEGVLRSDLDNDGRRHFVRA
ncbi:MAG: MBL fold metallo-hydrolase [Betaproteobacteria bacterium]|nr:MBL fold metallo-hydrolase [Betaproteobacteria bacterium]